MLRRPSKKDDKTPHAPAIVIIPQSPQVVRSKHRLADHNRHSVESLGSEASGVLSQAAGLQRVVPNNHDSLASSMAPVRDHNGPFAVPPPRAAETPAQRHINALHKELQQIVGEIKTEKGGRWVILNTKLLALNPTRLGVAMSTHGDKPLQGLIEAVAIARRGLEKKDGPRGDDAVMDELDFAIQQLTTLQNQKVGYEAEPESPHPLLTNPHHMSWGSESSVSQFSEASLATHVKHDKGGGEMAPPNRRPVSTKPRESLMVPSSKNDINERMQLLRIQLAVNLEALEDDIAGRRPSGASSGMTSPSVTKQDDRLKDIMKRAKETREQLHKDAPELWEPLPKYETDRELSAIIKRRTMGRASFATSISVAMSSGVGAFLEDPEDVEKLRGWLRHEVKRQEFEEAQGPELPPERNSYRNTLSMLDLYKGLSRSVSQWDLGPEPPDDEEDESPVLPPDEYASAALEAGVYPELQERLDDIMHTIEEFDPRNEAHETLITNFRASAKKLRSSLEQARLLRSGTDELEQQMGKVEKLLSMAKVPRVSKPRKAGGMQPSARAKPGNEEQMASIDGVVEDMIGVPDDAAVLHQNLEFLVRLSSTQATVVRFGERGGVPLLARALEAHVGSESLVHVGCVYLSKCLELSQLRGAFADLGGVGLLATVAEQWSNHTQIQYQWTHALTVACEEPACREQIDQGIVELLILAMDNHQHSGEMMHVGCWAVSSMCAMDVRLRNLLGENNVMSAVLGAMAKFPERVELHHQAFRALVNLTVQEQVCQSVVDQGGCQCAVDSLSRHRDKIQVQGAGCWCLAHMSMLESGRAELRAIGATAAVLDTMRMHPKSLTVQRCGCWVLANVLVEPDCPVEVANQGGIPLVLRAMARFVGDEDLQEYGCRAMHHFHVAGSIAEEDVGDEVGEALARALATHPNHAGIQYFAESVLQPDQAE